MTVEMEECIHLKPAISLKGYYHSLSLEEGCYCCELSVSKGEIIFHHEAYESENGCWDAAPDNNEIESLGIQKGDTRKIIFHCKAHHNQKDAIFISNASLLKEAEFQYKCIREN